MKRRALGSTAISISELGLGGLFVAGHSAEFKQAEATVRRAIELGVNYIDTAPGYGDSEEVLGKILKHVEAPVVVSTKLGGSPQPFLPQDKKCLRQSVEESLRLLHRDCIDILMIHEPDRPGHYGWWSDREEYSGPVLELLQELQDEGLIKHSGLGGTTAYEMARVIRAHSFDVVLTAFNYSLLWREAEHEVLPAAKEKHMGIVIGSPLQQGSLALRHDEAVKNGAPGLSLPRRRQLLALYQLLDDVEISIAELALRFVISNPAVSSVLMGARSPQEVEQNATAIGKGALPPEVLSRLDDIAAMVPFRPCDEPIYLPFGPEYSGPGPLC